MKISRIIQPTCWSAEQNASETGVYSGSEIVPGTVNTEADLAPLNAPVILGSGPHGTRGANPNHQRQIGDQEGMIRMWLSIFPTIIR